MKPSRMADGERTLAVFLDFENIGIGLKHRRDSFQVAKILERLVEKGKIVAKKSYADWSRYGPYSTMLHEAAFELIEIPKRSAIGKNSADIRLVVDAIDLAYSKDHIDTFVIVSGDSDFSPLVSKLKELGKHVIGIGLAEATSDLLRDNCDEFLYYDDLDKPTLSATFTSELPEDKKKVFGLLMESLLALRRENKEVLWSSMVKDTMKRKKPSFNEEYHGYRTFTQLLEDAQAGGFIELEKHKNSGTYVVTRFGEELKEDRASELLAAHPPATRPAPAAARPSLPPRPALPPRAASPTPPPVNGQRPPQPQPRQRQPEPPPRQRQPEPPPRQRQPEPPQARGRKPDPKPQSADDDLEDRMLDRVESRYGETSFGAGID